METTTLASSVEILKGVGPKLAQVLAKKGIRTLEDALYNFPRAYEDRRVLTPIAQLQPGQKATVFARVQSSRAIRMGRQMRFEAMVADHTGRLQLFWFRAFPGMAEEFKVGQLILVYGEVEFYGGLPKIVHPDHEKVTEVAHGKPVPSPNFGRLVPVYSETEGLQQKTIRRLMAEALRQSLSLVEDPLPQEMLSRLKLPGLKESFVKLHTPTEAGEGPPATALSRIAFEEFFILQLGLGLKKQKRQSEKAAPLVDTLGLLTRFVRDLPFELTDDQKNSIREIVADIGKSTSMTRLVQGDVGAGKTVVALAAAVVAASAGFQTALMAPTEILAQQHLRTAERLFAPLGVKSVLLSQGTAEKAEVMRQVAEGEAQLVVGTHALFQEAVKFSRLGLVIVDEQHRFGVEQRAELVRKAGTKLFPHVLLMTATPIPRTLALTLYGDLDLTIIREKPANRIPITTTILRERERPRLYTKMRELVKNGQQVYVIYPLVEASEKLDLKSATEMYERFRKEVFPDISVALLHGKMKGEEKDRILAEFKEGKYRILIATTVIEVGIDVPNATLMVIEHPERLGLSQLHQLRGRVGRGSLKSECVLLVDEFVSPRLRVFSQTEDGFEIAEEDLKLRGPGEFLGTRQSGLPGFRAGHILHDAGLVSVARDEAQGILERDPKLNAPEHERIRQMVESRWKEKIERLRGG